MKTRIIAPIAAAAFALAMTACASDEVPDEDPAVVVDDNDVPIDPSVEPGVDTNVETEENLGFEGDES